MGDIFVVVEHRNGILQDISFELLTRGYELSREHSHSLNAILLGAGDEVFVDELLQKSDKLIMVPDERLRHFDSGLYSHILCDLLA
jgi:electron transfer flavoprotein alpha subunit